MHTVMYQIWVKEGAGAALDQVWRQYGELLEELGMVRAWVVEGGCGRCDAYMSWQAETYWRQVDHYCNLMESVNVDMRGHVLGWLPAVAVPVEALPEVT